MSLPSPAWPQQDEPSPCGTTGGLPPASSDSDSGCALEEYLEPPEVPPCFGPRSPPPGSAPDRTRLRARALLQQLPPQDCDERYCPDLAEEERRQLRAFSARRRQEALGQGLACPVPGPCHGCPCRKCGRRLNKGDPGISASRLGNQFWHPSCFSCHLCHQQLVDLIYFQQDGRIYCGRHHAELFRPRCASCDQLIFMEECIEAEGRRWHLEHFCCLECDEPLRGQRYVMRSGRPCCRGCFESLFAEPCQACGDPIGADSEEVSHQGLHWHARASCFCCSLCRAPLRGQPLTCHRGRLFCSDTCSRGQDASSTASDSSSDSAFASAPSPECTALPRAGAAGGCRQRGEGAAPSPLPEAFPGQAPVHPAFRSPEDLGEAARERSSDAAKEHPGVLGPPTSHPSAPQPSPEPPNEPRALGHPLLGGPEPRRAAGNGNPQLQAGTSPAWHGPRAEHGTEEEEEEDSWCPTCSSSSDSDSEEEGFFFGKPIPKPGMNSLGREPPGRGRARTAKHCSVS
ncbi:prickle-like protein 4 isoform X1 [Serinus canaria]|uniref:prickle-like protein 4 isoform X1 n=1 Tax=Serinus canaria TaxID=9135 RepID=UPI0021CCC51E|nr:prickle-like protein 4 isoform X1 [Serinus canaria]XP_050841123.1 prickle-like protein 4 isoform X1 [Serinus canaria]XP_050841124.1 prickle-like protein 4 isoform X1 [Serinus canaria]